MLAYKLVAGGLFGVNIVVQVLKTVQATHYGQRRLAIINGIALMIAAALLIWTIAL